MSRMFETLNPDVVEMEQQLLLREIRTRFLHQEQLAIIGYVTPTRRARSIAATWLLHLATRLDSRIATQLAESGAPVSLRHA